MGVGIGTVPAESAATVVYGAPFQLTTGPGPRCAGSSSGHPLFRSAVFTVIWLNVEKMLFRAPRPNRYRWPAGIASRRGHTHAVEHEVGRDTSCKPNPWAPEKDHPLLATTAPPGATGAIPVR